MLALPWKEFSFDLYSGEFRVNGIPLTLIPSSHRQAKDQIDADTGSVVWSSSILLCQVLESLNYSYPDAPWKSKRHLELGSGTGVLGIALWLLGCPHVVLSDLSYYLPSIEASILHIASSLPSSPPLYSPLPSSPLSSSPLLSSLPQVRPLDWGAHIAWEKEEAPHYIFLSDVVWLSHLVEPLANALGFFFALNPQLRVVMVQQHRSLLVENLFWSLMMAKGVRRTMVSSTPCARSYFSSEGEGEERGEEKERERVSAVSSLETMEGETEESEREEDREGEENEGEERKGEERKTEFIKELEPLEGISMDEFRVHAEKLSRSLYITPISIFVLHK